MRFVLCALLCVGCGSNACDSSVVSSVVVTVLDGAGSPVTPDVVRYVVDDLPEAPCDALPQAHRFVCGWEETGAFTIRVRLGAEVREVSLDIGLRADQCHVDPQFVEIVVG